MSWGTVSATSVGKDELNNGLVAAKAAYLDQLAEKDMKLDAEAYEQLEAGTAAAIAAVATGAVGDGPFNIALSGHSNPNHVPTSPSDSPDFVVISVSSCVRAPEPAQAEAPSAEAADPVATADPSPQPGY